MSGHKRKGIRKCRVCLDQRHDVIKGICASCQPQDTPELRALLGIDAEGRKLQPSQIKKANSARSDSTTSEPKSQVPYVRSNGHSVWAIRENFVTRLPLVRRLLVWHIERQMDKAQEQAISNLGSEVR
jgi:hypothetical protein